MNWIRIATGIGRDSSLGAMSEALGVSVPTTTGHVVLVYTALAEGCVSGDLSDVADSVLERWAMWRGKRGRFAEVFRAQLCTPEGVVRSWSKYNGAKLRDMEADRERKRASREAAKLARESGGRPEDKNQTSGSRPPLRDVTRRDVTNNKEKTDRSVLPTAAAEPDRERSVDRSVDPLDAKFGGERVKPSPVVPPAAYASQLAELEAAALPHEKLALDTLIAGHPQPYALVFELHACASGMHGPIRGVSTGRTADVADVMRAVAEMAANGHAFSVKLFRGYLRRIADRPPEPASADERATAKLQAEIERRAPAELTRGERTADGSIVPVPIATEDTPEAKEARRVAREAAMAAFRAGQRRALEIDQQHGATQGEAA